MPIGPFGEILGTTGTLETLSESAQHYKSRVVAPRNPKLVKGEMPEFKMTPSQFMFQMSLDTEKKLANQHTMTIPKKVELLDMSETSHQKVSAINIDEPMFQPFPSEIFFQNFEPFETYEVPFLLRNNDKVPRLVKVSQADSPYFKILSPPSVGQKVGPGLPTTFKLQFTPEEKRDYSHELLCVTERERFVVPVRAIGARAILDFPDEVHFPVSPVKHTSSRILLVRNVGNREAKFSLQAERPFHVSPDNGSIALNESMQVTVEYKPTSVGDMHGDLLLQYDTGEPVHISLYGAAQDANVRLDKNSIRIENTYLSMANQRTVTISNRSDVIAHYHWTQFATQEEEDQQRIMYCQDLSGEESSEHDRFLEECLVDPSLRDKMAVLSRTFHNRRKLIGGDKMLFDDDVIKIEPAAGEIWPNSSAEISIVFHPREAKTYTRTAFCDVTGRESRLPLRVRGDGMGPKVQFSFDEMDMGNIFVNSTHTYELVLANKGDIDAIFSLVPSHSVFGPCFHLNPSEGIVMPDGHQAIQVAFTSTVLGDFREDFYFQIDGSPDKLNLTFTGSVIGPTFQFDVPKLKFGTVSYGFVNSQVCTLTNTALVPMTFSLRVRGDGTGESLSCTSEYDSTVSEAGSVVPPKEFEITPSSGTLAPQSEVKLQVGLCSNTTKKYDLSLVVDVEGVGEEVLALPLSARCVVPQVTVLTPILDYGRCFLRHPYEHHVRLQNDTDLPAKYELLPQQLDQFTSVLYTSPQPKGIVDPHSVTEVPLVITPQGLEELEVTAQFAIFGSSDTALPVHIMCIGEGPVVHVMPLDLEWSLIPVLTDTPKMIRLSNESLIPAKFTANMVRPNSVWRVEPNCGEISAEDQVELTVTASLDDCVRFQDKLQICFDNAPMRSVPLSGQGHGTTIVTDPPMSPVLNLGPHFSEGPCLRTFTLTNRGRRHQSLVWSSEGFHFPTAKRGGALPPLNPKDMKFKDMLAPSEASRPVFKLTPHRMELNPGESIDVQLEGRVEMPRLVREKMLCHAIIGRAGGKELIMKVQVNCEFISPLLQFSTDKLSFRVDKNPDDELQMMMEKLEVTNVSSLPLTTQLSLVYPFLLLDDEGKQLSQQDLYLGIGETHTVRVQFDPAYREDSHSRILDEALTISYKEHPHVDQIALRGEVYFPNLEFEKETVDFGCILNDTEVTRYFNIHNNSPMEVNYHWSFLLDGQPVATFNKPPSPLVEPLMEVEDLEGHAGSPEGSLAEEDQQQTEVVEHVQMDAADERTPRELDDDDDEEDELRDKSEVEEAEKMDDSVTGDKKDAEKGSVKEKKDEVPPTIVETSVEAQSQPEGEHQPEDSSSGHVAAQEHSDDRSPRTADTGPHSRAASRLTPSPRSEPPINPTLAALLQQEPEEQDLGVEEIFDILPLYGSLKPGETEQITLTFYGHAHIGSSVKAVCEVEGGPMYELELKGQASLVMHRFDCLDIDYSKIMYDQVSTAEITLMNTGHVGFEFVALGMDPAMASRPKPGVPVMILHAGFIEADSQQTLTIKFMPGVPEKFHKSFQIQVAHFEPDTVNLLGEGVFPRISLDLPRTGDEVGHYEGLVKEVRENLTKETKKTERPTSAVSAHRDTDNLSLQHENVPSELEVQMEVERLVVQEFAEEVQELSSRPDILTIEQLPAAQPAQQQQLSPASRESTKKPKRRNRPRPRLPDYLLDFSHVVLGTVRTHIVRATNTGWFPASFSVDREYLYQFGFNVELDRVKQLPGAPDHETVDFVVSFDPRGANLGLGEVDTVVPINIVNGPQVCINLRANVTMPDMQISTDVLEFADVKCGECKVITVQLYNHKHVMCEWNSLPTDKEKYKEMEKMKIDKHVPMHLRRKLMRQGKNKPRTFEMMPPTGTLMPGQRQNVQVKFMPTEEKYYEQRIAVRLAQSSQRIMLLCRGQGQEPNVELERSLVEFGPILPHSSGDEQEVVIHNPCKFPIEFYNLEFDRGYLEEEKILRLMKGYDEYNTILLPPRYPSEKLPQELLEYYEEQMRKLEEAERVRREAEEAAEAAQREQEEREAAEREKDDESGSKTGGTSAAVSQMGSQDGDVARTERSDLSKDQREEKGAKDLDRKEKRNILDEEDLKDKIVDKTGSTAGGVGELEITPVSAAIARHLGIDLSPEGKAARNRRGIAVIVHGAPLSGKTGTAVVIAKRYEAALLTIDGIILEAISNGNTPAGRRARELCAEVAHKHAEELRATEGEVEAEKKGAGGLSVEAVTAHTQGTVASIAGIAAAHSVAHSIASNRKTSTISDQKSKDKHHGSSTVGAGKANLPAPPGGGDVVSQQDMYGMCRSGTQTSLTLSHHSQTHSVSGLARQLPVAAHTPSSWDRTPRKLTSARMRTSRQFSRHLHPHSEDAAEVPSSPPPLAAPISRRLSISASVAGEEGLMSCVLPEDLLVELLAERLLLNDCHRGVVFDGLETLFSQNQLTSTQAILKALNNRKYMFFITLKLDYSVMKEQEKQAQEEQERNMREQEEEERRRLEDMSEDEYDALEEEDKAGVDKKRLEIKKERLRRELEEKQERERREREAWEAEQRRLEDERQTKRVKRAGHKDTGKDGKKPPPAGAKGMDTTKSTERMGQIKLQEGKKAHVESEHALGKATAATGERPESHYTERERGESAEEGKKKKEKAGKDGKRPISNEAEQGKKGKGKDGQAVDLEGEEPAKPPMSEAELLLMQRFRTFDHSFKEISDLVDRWERSTGLLRPCTPSDGVGDLAEEAHIHPPSGRKNKKADKHEKPAKDKETEKKVEKSNEKASKDNKEAANLEVVDGDTTDAGSEQTPPLTEEERREKRLEDGIGVPHILLECASADERDQLSGGSVIETGKLPSVEEVLDGLGMGARGPPIPPPAVFSVVPYPVKRHAPPGAEQGHYAFVASSPDDPNIALPEEKAKDDETEDDKSITPEGRKDDHITPTKGKGKGSDKLQPESKKDKRRTSAKSKTGRRSSMQAISPPPGAATPASEAEGSTADTALQEAKTPKLLVFRWVVPAEGDITLRLRFMSEDLGQFDQTLNFEIMGTRRRYQLYCRGVCAFPTISREPRIVFPQRKKSKKSDEIVHKKYILTSELYEFGPLLVGKSRDKYKEGRFPENMEKLTVMNTSPLEADISFCFLHDSKGETYLLDPPTMLLQPGQQQNLTIWAYPKQGTYEDAVVCCVKENPEPIIFKIVSNGVRPELELDKKVFHFDKVLLHRKDTKTVYLRNSTLLPVAWRLNGLDNLGDDFSVSQESGLIEPKSEFALHGYFRAMKPVNTSKKSIRLEISDVDNIMGLVQTEYIQIHAEAYDVALDMSFPKGADGGIDFDIIRVLDEQRQTCNLKNKGKYDIGYAFMFESTETCPEDVSRMFSVVPQRGTLSAVDRPVQVQVIFRSNREVSVKEQPILRCQVMEPSLGDEGETIASIPIKLSVRSVFSKYTIYPVNDMNFGAMVVNSKKTRTFTIENKGDRFEFKYTIIRMVKEVKQLDDKRRLGVKGKDTRAKSRDGSSSGRSMARPKRAESISDGEGQFAPKIDADKQKKKQRQDLPGAGAGGAGGGGGAGGPNRLVLGMFSIYPAFFTISPGSQQIIQVDCVAENAGRCEEEIAIDITGRDPDDHPSGIPYRLIAEACVPSINILDIGSIFEEHRVCQNLSVWQHTHTVEGGGVFGQDENRFVFNNVLVGARAQARFKMSNINKVPCDVVFSVKVSTSKHATKLPEVFEVDPPRAQISAHGHIYAVVTFIPPSMQQFTSTFEATLEGLPSNQIKGRSLSFELLGEGNLPRISIQKPNVRNKKGQPLLLFKRNLIGRNQLLPVLLVNDGTLPSKVDIDLFDPDKAFSVKPTGVTQAVITEASSVDDHKRHPHTASVIIAVGETASFDVSFCPTLVQRSQGSIRLSVVNNQYEDSVIQLVGEGYEDDITLDNIHSVVTPIDPEQEEGSMADDDIPAAKCNLIRFGDCFINEPRTLSFSLSNHSNTDCVRFQWPDHPQLKFSPQVGHLHPGCPKDLTVTFRTDQPVTLEEQEVPCKITRIAFDKPIHEVADWDDRVKTVKWVDVPSTGAPLPAPSTDSSNNKASTPIPPPSARPAKKKVVETEVEPPYSEVSDSSRTVELLVSVIADYCKYKCKVETIHFRDTLMLQTRIFDFHLSNKGSVSMDYSWQIAVDSVPTQGAARSVTFANSESRPPTAMSMVARSDEARPSSAVSSATSDGGYMPLSVEPETGRIPPGKAASCTVKFSPLDVNDYESRLVCSVSNLEEGTEGPVIPIKARSLMPYCHFELEDCDYIRSARRNPELRGPKGAPAGTTLDPNTRVIEYFSVGVGVSNIRRFSIVNPTNQHYSFEWLNEDEPNPKHPSSFSCLATEGKIRSGKKVEVGFEFTSSTLDLVESFWRFVIPEQNISVPFLLVGNTQDPGITLDRSHLNFKSLLIGHEAQETIFLTNNEAQPFQFAFVESSLFAAGYSANLMVDIMSGVIPPNSTIPIQLSFTPNSEKEVNFNMVCAVKKKTLPLTLNVKAEGYSMNCLVLCEDSLGNKVELAGLLNRVDAAAGPVNQINFGEVEVNEKAVRNIYIVNSGKFNFGYTWELRERSAGRENMVSVTPESGAVTFGEREQCQLAFWPQRQTALRGCELVLKISNGPTYVMQIAGTGVLPGLHFSFVTYNFGPCFIHRVGLPVNTVPLRITNTDRKEISVDCLYTPTCHLHHDFEAKVIASKQTVDVNLTFYPRDPVKYQETVTFEVNGLSKQSVEICGQGAEMKIEVLDPKQKTVKLGALRVGQTVKKIVPVINKSPSPITFHLAITPSNSALQDARVLKIAPMDEIALPAKGGTAKVEVIFSPKCRIPQFTEEVLLECAGMFQPLFVVNGACQGIDINLETDAIPFGAVVEKSSSTRKLMLLNTGDIGARFKWDAAKFEPDFSVSPVEGYISPGMEVPLEIIFHPQKVNNDIRYDNLRCQIEGTKALRLTLTGMCIAVPSSKEVVHFSTHVRQREQKNLQVPNRTNMLCTLRPIIDGEYWSGPDTFMLEPQATKPYELTYLPLTMTQDQKRHMGTVFFPFPDGTGLMYNVSGSADAPKFTSKFTKDVPCKTSYVETLTISNWLKKPQRFKVKTEMIRPDKLDSGTTVKGLDYIDVPGNSKKDYKLTFYAHKEGQSQMKVIFLNESTGEYQYYEVMFRATKPGVISTIDLTTPVRQSVPYTLMLDNQLPYAITFLATCNVPEVLMPNQLSVPASSEGAFNFEYLPLKVGEMAGHLEFLSNDLGLYIYDLKLKATNAGPERALYFRTCLGTGLVQTAKFLNFAKQKTDYACKADQSDFHVDKTVAAAPGSSTGTEVAVEVTFEPCHIGEFRGMLTVSSPAGGDYTFPLFGTCIAPKPQGPFVVKAGTTTSISFRNVFPHTTAFLFQVDNPLFHVTKPGDNMRPRKEHRIVVGFDGNDSGSKAAVMGKLIVSCAKSAGGSTNAQWVYYLKGVTPESTK